jgi:hypothetical protein
MITMPDNGNGGHLVEPMEKKTRHRSPNYPGIGLRDAVQKVSAIYKADALAGSPKVAALRHMGFENSHGEAGRVVSALKSFGLIEEVNEMIKITPRGVNIVARPDGDQQRSDALREAAVSPEIYAELIRQYQHSGLPGNTSLESELKAAKRFNPNAVDGFIRDFRDTLDFAGLSDLSVVELKPREETGANKAYAGSSRGVKRTATEANVFPIQSPEIQPPVVPSTDVKPMQTAATFPTSQASISLLVQTLPISIPRNLRVDVQVQGDELKKEDLTKIKSQITRWLEGLEEAFE